MVELNGCRQKVKTISTKKVKIYSCVVTPSVIYLTSTKIGLLKWLSKSELGRLCVDTQSLSEPRDFEAVSTQFMNHSFTVHGRPNSCQNQNFFNVCQYFSIKVYFNLFRLSIWYTKFYQHWMAKKFKIFFQCFLR